MLPSLTKIQNLLVEKNPSEYEELVRVVFEYVYKHRPGFTSSHKGKTFGKDHPSSHPVDIEITYNDENDSLHHVLIAASNQKNNLFTPNGKLREDCSSILEYIKKFDIKNAEIIAAYVKNPSENENPNFVAVVDELRLEGIKLTLVNAETLNIYINEYCPFVYKQFLGLNVYSGGISYLDEQIDDKLGDYYKHKLLGRESELSELKNLLIQKRTLLIRGHSGCGKTRIAIELAKTVFPSNFRCLWVNSFNLSSIDDLDQFCDKSQKTIVIVDDINKISFINELLNKILQKENTYIIMTVRDYLFEEYKRKVDIDYYEYHLKDLEPNKIKEILKSLFNVDDEHLDYILLVTRNNLRFSIMAANVLVVEKKRSKSIISIFDAYYKELITKTGIEENESLKKTIVALAFFDSLDLRSEEENKNICLNFDIPKDDFLEMCNLAHEKEIADFYFDKMLIKISDQIFAEYLFYKYVFVFKKIDIFDLFRAYYRNRKDKFVHIFSAFVNIYREADGFEEELNKFKNKVVASNDKQLVVSFFSIFSKIFIDDSIEYSFNELNKCDEVIAGDYETMLNTESYRELCDIFLSNYDSKQYTKVVRLLLKLLQKENLRSSLISKIESRCSIKKDYVNIVPFYKKLIDGLCELSKTNDDYLEPLFIVTKKTYPYESDYTEFNDERSVTFCRMVLPFNESYKQLRDSVWNAIDILHKKHFNEKKLNEMVKYNFAMGDIVQYKKYDLQHALAIAKSLDFSQPRDVVFAYNLLKQFDKFQDVKDFIKGIAVDEDTKLYYDFVVSKLSNKYGDEYKKALISRCFKKYTSPNEFVLLISSFYKKYGRYDSWVSNSIVAYAFEYLASLSKEYDKYLIVFLTSNPDYSGNPIFLTSLLVDKNGFIGWAEKSSLSNKNSFIASVLFSFKPSEINDELYDYALKFFTHTFTKTFSSWGNENILSLKNFEEYRQGFIYQILKKIEVDKTTCNFIEDLFFVRDSIDSIYSLLNNDLLLFKKIYFGLLTNSRFYDHDGRVTLFLLEKDPSLLNEILRLIVDGKTDIDKFNYLYPLPGFVEVFINIIITSRFAHINFAISHCVEKMPDDLFISLADTFIKRYKGNLNYMQEFSIIAEHRELQSQIEFVDLLISNKVDIEIFERLFLIGGPTSWSGSRIPYLNKNIEAIRNYLNNKELADEYKDELEKIILRLKKNIRYEEIEEFNRG